MVSGSAHRPAGMTASAVSYREKAFIMQKWVKSERVEDWKSLLGTVQIVGALCKSGGRQSGGVEAVDVSTLTEIGSTATFYSFKVRCR
jgi:hypothetical protein